MFCVKFTCQLINGTFSGGFCTNLQFENNLSLPFLSMFLGTSWKLFGMCIRSNKLNRTQYKFNFQLLYTLFLLLEMSSSLHGTTPWLKTRFQHNLLHEVSLLCLLGISHFLPWIIIICVVCKDGHIFSHLCAHMLLFQSKSRLDSCDFLTNRIQGMWHSVN